ncbi:ABC transporter substrate-binding protein/permease [Vitiosangium sp. GDMCC 1.1324]|uniref:ABC transporter substrate-binding protein/permease n=1 Tax=Vitiosangium sp. (strain GDMCC 1.1324) TaxID=2138576 RepID=UPI000D393F32|nr:ABC transporter substrate-binding protein/permease [Vitiosangium sp. GDMCC 1.1324]PTL78790.1 glutamine ABC transporter substrate-binding protein [Vitiosangium sp. GDMCC 1.1324]
MRRWSLAIGCILLAAFLPGLAAGDEPPNVPATAPAGALARIRASGVLRVAIDATYPPMEFLENGQPVGFDVELAREIARRLGVTAQFIVMDWDGILAGLTSGRYDIILSSMNITPARQQQVDFVEYARLSQVFVTTRGRNIRTEQELAGHSVAVQTNTTSQRWVEQLQQRGIAVREIRAFPGATESFAALKSGQADVIVVDEPVGLYFAHEDDTFVITGQALEPEPIGIAINKQDADLTAAITQAFADIKASGELKRLSERWFGGELGQTAKPRGFWVFSREVVLPRVLQGLGVTLQLTLGSGVLGIALGLLVALARISRRSGLRAVAVAYITLFRGTPLLLQLLFIFFALPLFAGIRMGPMAAGLSALSLNAAAYIAEIFRAAIESIDKGQMEAARALGMSHELAMRRVILPQTFRRLIPPLVNELAALSKDTSLVMVIALPEMLYETKQIAGTYLRPEVYAWAAIGYLIIVVALSTLAQRLERRMEARGT